jgi:integrase
MAKDYAHKRELKRAAIEDSVDISDADRELLIEFDDTLALRQSEFAEATRYKLLQYCGLMAGHSSTIPTEALPDVELAAVLEDRDAAEDMVRWMHDTYDNEESNAGMRRALRTFGRVLTDGEETPETLEWIPTRVASTYDAAPDPSEMLSWDDTLTLIDNVHNERDAALLAVAWDSGARGEELVDLTVGDVTDHRHGLRITVHGKQGQRTVTLIPSVPFLQRWLAPGAHPDPTDSDAPVWCNLNRPEQVSYETLWKAITRAGERADIDKPVNFTNFRKSSASYLASQGMNQAHLEDHHGWVRGSDVAARYVAVFADAADNELARIHGKDVTEETPDPVGPIECPRCGELTPTERDYCIHCSQTLDHETDDLLQEVRNLFDEKTIAAEDPDQAADLVSGRRKLEENPAALDKSDLHELLSSIE